MAELTHLEEKLAEVTGLAMAAEAADTKISKLTEKQDKSLVASPQTIADEAAETARRCERVAGGFEGKKTAILDEAREVKKKAAEMMSTYLDRDADALDGFEFLTIACRRAGPERVGVADGVSAHDAHAAARPGARGATSSSFSERKRTARRSVVSCRGRCREGRRFRTGQRERSLLRTYSRGGR